MKVLDVATGTGLAAEACLRTVGPNGHVVIADLSTAMVEQAKRRLGAARNVTFAVENGQSLSFADQSFDAVICSLELMFFPDPLRGLSEFLRVLGPGRRAAVSLLTVPESSYNGRINAVIARHLPAISEATARTFVLGDVARRTAQDSATQRRHSVHGEGPGDHARHFGRFQGTDGIRGGYPQSHPAAFHASGGRTG
jgi:ubiquinone/menaquinone biosynthesis C-methylase UbiE